MKLTVQAYSDKGCIRDHNEDMLSLGGYLLRDAFTDFTVNIQEMGKFHLLVSDGMGGHEKGEVASRELLESIDKLMTDRKFDSPEAFVSTFADHLAGISAGFNRRAVEEGQKSAMGCTLTGVIWVLGQILLVNSGDSRTYRFRNGRLTQLTTDDTERGITGNGEDKKLLLSCIGAGSTGAVKVENITDRLLDEDMLVICSDGLTDEVSEDEMEVILSNDFEPASGLVERARDNGGHDNISVIVALVGEGEFAPGLNDEDYIDDDGRFDAWA